MCNIIVLPELQNLMILHRTLNEKRQSLLHIVGFCANVIQRIGLFLQTRRREVTTGACAGRTSRGSSGALNELDGAGLSCV